MEKGYGTDFYAGKVSELFNSIPLLLYTLLVWSESMFVSLFDCSPVWRCILLSACLSVRLSVCLSTCLSACPPVCRPYAPHNHPIDLPAGDEDNGEQGAWFVLSALGLFSTVPGSPFMVLGSPIFKHVRVWRGKCETDAVSKEVTCDYSYGMSEEREGKEGKGVYVFPPESSYLDIVALGTSSSVSRVAEITLNGEPLPPGVDYSRRGAFRDTGASTDILPTALKTCCC